METTHVISALGALAQETRLSIFRLLVEAGPAGAPAGTIAAKLGVAAPTLSFHLKELAHAGLVTSESQGRFVVYRADFGSMNALLEFLTANCCRGSACCDAGTRATAPAIGKPRPAGAAKPRRAR